MDVVIAKEMMAYVAKQMVASEPVLTKFDQTIGDGDHGIGMERGFKAVQELLADESYQPADVSKLLLKIGSTMMATMGGASGAIFGTLFRSGAKAIKGATELNAETLSEFLSAGLQGVYERGGAKPGDKTMIDALVAAVKESESRKGDLAENLPAIAAAAQQGVEATKDMIATTGKAKTLGERSLGHPDPGAVSMAFILQFMTEFATEQVTA
ncbi:dihydroxyacetone kinase subunit DhaL [Vibrio breoganii]|uniref:Dihydroxyacetone kinase subunit L n=1 Tax=Vibrio breoganii TaxID=553239 RepID=A0AAN0XVL4_9VIBR|nr:dihydroxyacetone kinase subunit DhaL [Vibrio breoganii]ANO33339.1 dihydroxyacetone kinase subunit L [Vibrio breoganii]MDN3716688.1 dihydroxyacetone kinase subunit DhaL [Vibrio breoganii]OED96039.1 dihydroxyacetone kinase subunit L [Vibrio breoganii ZF-55]PMG07190.1 dihydroxyacetone kinase subunit L [Vibrio breoganii]PMG86226.1 dihydroxyacetone kinase subunit L [Vibrio breoganii]